MTDATIEARSPTPASWPTPTRLRTTAGPTAPVAWSDAWGAWVVSRYEDVVTPVCGQATYAPARQRDPVNAT